VITNIRNPLLFYFFYFHFQTQPSDSEQVHNCTIHLCTIAFFVIKKGPESISTLSPTLYWDTEISISSSIQPLLITFISSSLTTAGLPNQKR
jgi:hypothetical protein